jgi:thiol-disulfide isomerase/thioredoxin
MWRGAVAMLAMGAAHFSFASSYLDIGSQAPSLAAAKWLKGVPTPHFEKGKIYVVEFWATWCGPCKANIPHLTQVAAKFKDKVSVIGVSIWESTDPTSTSYLKKVSQFVKSEGDKMGYNVAVDDPSSTIANSWMKAAGEGGIPKSFVIGPDGKIAWIGYPLQLDGVLDQVLAGKFDSASAKTGRDLELSTIRPIQEAMDAKQYGKALTMIDAAVAKQPNLQRMYDYSRLVALFHVDVPKAIATSDEIIKSSNGDIGAYRMICSITATQPDLTQECYRYGQTLIDAAIAKNEMKYMFLAMDADVKESLKDPAGAIDMQTQAVAAMEHDPHAPADFVETMRKKLDHMRSLAQAGK